MASAPLLPNDVYAVLSSVKPDDAAVVMESTSTLADLIKWWPTRRTGSFFATGSGGIGWGVPAAVGVALGDRAPRRQANHRRLDRRQFVPVLDPGHLDSRAAQSCPIVFVVQRNGEYCVLKSFALLEETPNVPGLDLPGLDIGSLATGFGCRTSQRGEHRTPRQANSRPPSKLTDPPSWSCRHNPNYLSWADGRCPFTPARRCSRR